MSKQNLVESMQNPDKKIPKVTQSSSFVQPLNSKDDILIELLLIHKHNVKAYSKWNYSDDCTICLDSMKDQYVLRYPCSPEHVFHRNCLLACVLTYDVVCPICSTYPSVNT